jgi:hypothetical protein
MQPQDVYVKVPAESNEIDFALATWSVKEERYFIYPLEPIKPLPERYVLTREELEALLREAILKAWDKTEDTQNIGDLVSQLLTPKP